MKKIGYLMIALVCALFVGCSSCSDNTVVYKTVDFNEALLKTNLEVLKKFPSAQFYEAQGFLVKKDSTDELDGTVYVEHFRVAYNFMDTDHQKTIIGTLDENLKVKIELINDVWTEDIVATPYVSMTAKDAIKILNSTLDEKIESGPITLRHQLYPGEPEPRYFIGSLDRLHTVNVYTGKVDVPVGINDTEIE